VAWLAVMACGLAAARADEPTPQQRAAAEEAGRLLRAGVKALRAALPDGATAEEVAAAKDQEKAAVRERQRQIDQQAQHMQRAFQPALEAELELVRRTCGSLPPAARGKIRAAGDEAVKAVARQFAEGQMNARPILGFEPARAMHDAVAAAVKPHATAEEFAAYEREHGARTERRARAARIRIVDKVDGQLELTRGQREAIEADIAKQWKADWVRELGDGGIQIGEYRPAPDFAAACIVPHLDERQKSEWKQWCQQAGWSRLGRHHMGWNFDGQSLPNDPWWSP
jgi:hypothetical protein